MEKIQMPQNPLHPLSVMERAVFGQNARRNLHTGMVLEEGVGSLPEKEQTEMHCRVIEAAEGREVADAIRRKLGLRIPHEIEAEQARQQRTHEERLQRAYAALEKEEAEAKKEPRPLLSNLH
jgi:hypothetical protein